MNELAAGFALGVGLSAGTALLFIAALVVASRDPYGGDDEAH